jgi:hypothetical protein
MNRKTPISFDLHDDENVVNEDAERLKDDDDKPDEFEIVVEEKRITFVSSVSDLERYKASVTSALRNFVMNPDLAAFATFIRDLDMTVYHQDLVKIIVLFGLDQLIEKREILIKVDIHLFPET